jgi:quercetin dioxygenase-like cupin family protein
MERLRSGRLVDAAEAPATGEHHEVVARLGDVVVEQILSGEILEPRHFLSDDDEWVVVLGGAARLTSGDESFELVSGDWLEIPAGVPHVLERAEPGTVWVAVHAARARGSG